MSKFQSTISTVAALGTIAVTAVTAYKFSENSKIYNAEQEAKIEQLKTQLNQQPVVITQPPPVVLPPAVVTTPDPTIEGSAQAPPPLPPVQ